jgi:predicted ATP-binding protein involved in virulence
MSSANQRLSATGAGIKDSDFRIEPWGKERWGASDYAQVLIETASGLRWDCWRPSTAGKTPADKIGESALAAYLARISESLKTAQPELLPVFAYYGAQRGRIEIPERLRSSKENYAHPASALAGALDSLSNFKEMLKWFDIEESNELRANKHFNQKYDDFMPSPSLDAVRSSIETILGGAYKNPYFNKDHKFVLESAEAGKPLQVSQLSQGYQSMLALGMDFARRLALANSHLQYSLDDPSNLLRALMQDAHERGWQPEGEPPPAPMFAPAIMLVDEIDLHLHPSWQQRVLGDLMRTFPGTQFIVTTHSPQVLTTARKEHICVIRKTAEDYAAERPAMSPLARHSGDALAYVMDTHARPPLDAILEKVHAYEHLARNGLKDSEEGCQLKEELDKEGYEIPEADLALWEFLGQQARKTKA